MLEALRKRFRKKKSEFLVYIGLFFVLIFSLSYFFFDYHADAATPPTIVTYQGKLQINGTAATSTQSMYFFIYDNLAGGNLLYTANGTLNAPLALDVTPINGLFTVNLGDIDTNVLDPTLFRDNAALYLEVKIGDQTLSPRKRITVSPYAVNAHYLDGVGVNTVSSSTYIPVSANDGSFQFNTTTIVTSTITSANINTSTINVANVGTLNVLAGLSLPNSVIATSSLINGEYLTARNADESIAGLWKFSATTTFATTTMASTAIGTAHIDNLIVSGSLALPNNSVTDAMVADDITAANYLPLAGGTLSGDLTVGGLARLSGGLVTGVSTMGNLTVTSTLDVTGANVLGLSATNLTDGATLAYLTKDQTFTGLNIFSAVTTFATTTMASTTINTANIVNANADTLNVSGQSILNNVSSTALTVSNYVSSTNLYVNGDTTLYGNVTLRGTFPKYVGYNNLTGIYFPSNAEYLSNSSGNFRINIDSNANAVGNYFEVATDASAMTGGTVLMRVDDNGNVGIGTATASDRLTVVGGNITVGDGTASSTVSKNSIIINTSLDHTLGRFYVDSTGNVSASGTLALTNTDLGVVSSTASNLRLAADGAKDVEVWTNGQEKMRITSDGRVGIGTSTPGYALAVNGDAYVAGTTTVANLFNNPGRVLNPVVLQNFMTDSQHIVDLEVHGDLAYALNDNGIDRLDILNISEHSTSTIVGSANMPGSKFRIQGNYAYDLNGTQLDVYEISDPSNVTLVGSYHNLNSLVALNVQGKYALVQDSTGLLFVLDVSNVKQITKVGSLGGLTAPGGDMEVVGRYAYLMGDSGQYYIVDISDPTKPVLKSTNNIAVRIPYSAAVQGSFLYIAGQDGLRIIDISNPNSPVVKGAAAAGGSQSRVVAVEGNYGYVGTINGLYIYDISSSTNPGLVSTTLAEHIITSIYEEGNYLYVATQDHGMYVLDVAGSKISNAEIGAAKISDVSIMGAANFDQNLNVRGGLTVGKSGLLLNGDLGMSGDTFNYLNFSTTTVLTSGVQNYAGASAFVLNAANLDSSQENYILKLQADTSDMFAFESDGGLRIGDDMITNPSSPYSIRLAHDGGDVFLETDSTDAAEGLIMHGNANLNEDAGVVRNIDSNGYANGWAQGLHIFTSAAEPVIFSTANAERMRIDSDGRIGMGTSTPTYLLDVYGGVATDFLRFASSTNSNIFTIDRNGAVGVGTAPNLGLGKLVVDGAINATQVMSGDWGFDNAGNFGGIGGAGTPMNFIVDTETRMRLDDEKLSLTGGLAVGYNAVGYTLGRFNVDSTGNVSASGTLALTNTDLGVVSSTASNLRLAADGAKDVEVWTNGQEKMRITSDGRVGIGTSTPSEKMQLNGGNFLQTAGNPVYKGAIKYSDIDGNQLKNATGVYVLGRYAYVLSSSDNSLSIIDVSNPARPTAVGYIKDGVGAKRLAGAEDIFVAGQYAYVASFQDRALTIIDVSDPHNPKEVGSIYDNSIQGGTATQLNGADRVYVAGKYAYIASSLDNSLSIIDVSDPRDPKEVGTIVDGVGATQLAYPFGVYVVGKYAYVTSRNDNALSVIDVSNPSSPKEVGTIVDDESGGTATQLDGAMGVYVSGKYAYVASMDDSSLSVIDISEPFAPRQVGTITDNSAGGAAAHLQEVRRVKVVGKYAYVTTQLDESLTVLDISDPANIKEVGVVVDDAEKSMSSPYGIYISGKYAYVASFGDSALAVLDISGVDAPAANIGSIESSALTVNEDVNIGNNLYVRNGLITGNGGLLSGGAISISASSTGYITNLLSIFSSSTNAVLPVLIANDSGSVGIGTATPTEKLTVSGGNLAITNTTATSTLGANFLIVGSNTSDPQGKFYVDSSGNVSASGSVRIYGNVTSTGSIYVGTKTVINPDSYLLSAGSPVHRSSTSSAMLAGADGIDIVGNFAYVTSLSGDRLEILDISNPNNPVGVGGITDDVTTALDGASHVSVVGRYAYVTASNDDGLEIIDISNPSKPTHVGKITTTSCPTCKLDGASGIKVVGHYAYILAFNNSALEIVDVSNPNNPVHVGNVTMSEATNGGTIDVVGHYAYIPVGFEIQIVDVADPANPVIVGTSSNGPVTYDVKVRGHYAYVANEIGLDIFDVANPAAPILVGRLDNTACDAAYGSCPLRGSHGINISGKYAYLTSHTENGVAVVDVSNPANPSYVGSVVDSADTLLSDPRQISISGGNAYITSYGENGVEVLDISNVSAPSANIGNIKSGALNVDQDASVGGNLYVSNGLVVGAGGIYSQGTIAGFASSTPNSATTKAAGYFVGYASSTPLVLDRAGSNNDGTLVSFRQNNVEQGAIAVSGGVVTYGGFTGSHYAWSSDSLDRGMLTIMTDENRIKGGGTSGEMVYGVTSSTLANDPRVLGSYLGPQLSDNDSLVMAVGNGEMWVADNGENINSGDYLISSDVPGHAMKDKREFDVSYVVARAAENVDWSKVTDTINGVKHKKISVFFENYARDNSFIKNFTIDAVNGKIVLSSSTNPFSLNLNGDLVMLGGTVNKLSFATTTLFETAAGANATAFIMNAINGENSSGQLLSIRTNNNPVFSVSANGNVQTIGDIFATNLHLGSPGQPGDLSEKVDIAIDDTVEAGDVLVVDKNSPDTYRRNEESFAQEVAGVVSTNPTIVVGNGHTDYTAVMAMTGRVPVKVSAENGAIARGDLLVSASSAGYAMKYDASKDERVGMVGVIGVALEPLESGTGKVMALIRTGWVYNRNQTITAMQEDIREFVSAKGDNTASGSDDLQVQNNNGQLVYTNGDLNLQGNSLLGVSSIRGQNNKWAIDVNGHFITRIQTSAGEKDMYAMQSPAIELVFSSSSQLINGEVKIVFDAQTRELIDFNQPLKVNVTLTSGEAKGIYVSEKNTTGFTVKELSDGNSNATFDWMVVAKRKEGGASSVEPVENTGQDASNTSGLEQPIQPEQNEVQPPVINEPTSTPEKQEEQPVEGVQSSPTDSVQNVQEPVAEGTAGQEEVQNPAQDNSLPAPDTAVNQPAAQ